MRLWNYGRSLWIGRQLANDLLRIEGALSGFSLRVLCLMISEDASQEYLCEGSLVMCLKDIADPSVRDSAISLVLQ